MRLSNNSRNLLRTFILICICYSIITTLKGKPSSMADPLSILGPFLSSITCIEIDFRQLYSTAPSECNFVTIYSFILKKNFSYFHVFIYLFSKHLLKYVLGFRHYSMYYEYKDREKPDPSCWKALRLVEYNR